MPKIEKIAEVLDVSLSTLFEEKPVNFIQENCSVDYKNSAIIQHHKEYIESLKEEILFLRKLLEKNI